MSRTLPFLVPVTHPVCPDAPPSEADRVWWYGQFEPDAEPPAPPSEPTAAEESAPETELELEVAWRHYRAAVARHQRATKAYRLSGLLGGWHSSWSPADTREHEIWAGLLGRLCRSRIEATDKVRRIVRRLRKRGALGGR